MGFFSFLVHFWLFFSKSAQTVTKLIIQLCCKVRICAHKYALDAQTVGAANLRSTRCKVKKITARKKALRIGNHFIVLLCSYLPGNVLLIGSYPPPGVRPENYFASIYLDIVILPFKKKFSTWKETLNIPHFQSFEGNFVQKWN